MLRNFSLETSYGRTKLLFVCVFFFFTELIMNDEYKTEMTIKRSARECSFSARDNHGRHPASATAALPPPLISLRSRADRSGEQLPLTLSGLVVRRPAPEPASPDRSRQPRPTVSVLSWQRRRCVSTQKASSRRNVRPRAARIDRRAMTYDCTVWSQGDD